MKTNKKIDKFLLHCRSVLALVLCVVMLGNMTLEARGISSVSTQHIRTQVAERVNQFSTPKTPEQFLNDTREELEKLLTEEAPSEDALSKLTLQQYSIAYTKELDKFYQQQTDLLAQKVKTALAEFDKEAAAAWQTAQQNFENTQGTMTSQELMMAQEELKRYEKYLEDEKKQYAILVEQERAGWEKQLNEEHAAYIKNIPQEYATYSNEYDAALKDLEKTQIEFYKELIAQIILNYQQTRDIESKENFITLMLYLSSFTQKDQFFTKGDKQFALQELAKNFQTQGVCGGHVSVEYDSRGTWGTSFIGGSPSAGKIVDVQMNKKYVYKLSDEQGCNLALSSLIPFANLNGSGHDITKFLKDNFDNPMFGQMLLIGAKALTLTRNHNMEAFDKFMDEAIETEIASSKRSFWGKAWDMASFEEMSGAIFSGLDGKYMSHNVSSSAKRGIGEPNVWEDVAQLLVEYNTPQADAILKKAIDRCALRRKGVPPQEEQHLECRGIYPFLLGVITQKPELVENLVVEPLRINDNPGPEFTSTGRTRIVTEEEAKERHQYKLQHDISLKFTKGEMLGHFFYDQFFEDIYPDDKLRMDTLLANVATLNPKNTMTAYLKNDERYHKLEKRFNKNLVVRGIGSIGDTIVTIWCIKDLFLLLFRIGPALKNLSNFMKIRKVIIEYRLFPNTMSKSLKMAHALQARGITTAQLQKHHAFLTKVTNFKKGIRQVPNIRTKIIAHFTEGRVSPLSQGSVGSLRQHGVAHHLRQGGKGVRLSKVSAGAPSPTLRPMQQVKAAVKGSLFADAWRWATPKIAADTKEATFFNVNDAHFTYTDKAGKPLEITEIKIQDGVLYINGEMAKTYKAYLSLEQLEALAAMASEEKVTLGFNGCNAGSADRRR